MAFCINCGQKLAEGSKFCNNCGTKVGTMNVEESKSTDYTYVEEKKYHKLFLKKLQNDKMYMKVKFINVLIAEIQ